MAISVCVCGGCAATWREDGFTGGGCMIGTAPSGAKKCGMGHTKNKCVRAIRKSILRPTYTSIPPREEKNDQENSK